MELIRNYEYDLSSKRFNSLEDTEIENLKKELKKERKKYEKDVLKFGLLKNKTDNTIISCEELGSLIAKNISNMLEIKLRRKLRINLPKNFLIVGGTAANYLLDMEQRKADTATVLDLEEALEEPMCSKDCTDMFVRPQKTYEKPVGSLKRLLRRYRIRPLKYD